MKFLSTPAPILHILFTSDSVQKQLEVATRNSKLDNVSLQFHKLFQEMRLPSTEWDSGIKNRIAILDEGELSKINELVADQNLFILILGTELSDVKHYDHPRIFLLKTLNELLEQFDILLELVWDNYLGEYKKHGEYNLKEFLRLSQTKDINLYLENLSSEERAHLQEFVMSLLYHPPTSLTALQTILPQFSIVREDQLPFKNLFLLPIPFLFSSSDIFWGLSANIDQLSLTKLRILYSVNSFLSADLIHETSNLWQELKAYPYPLAVIEGDELIFYSENFFFKQFSIIDIRNLENGTLVEKGQERYIAWISHFDTYELVLLIPQDQHELQGAISSQELGIVTSSIAHELNNPLAGILSATSVLKLEDFWDQDELDALDEIELTAKRCKKIIEIFLGFSRGASFHDKDFQMREVIEQALELIRYRSAELDIHLLLHFDEHDTDIRCHKISLLTMVFYLIFSELLTLVNHEILVVEDSNIHNLEVDIKLTSHNVKLNFINLSPHILDKLSLFEKNSRLLRHLLSQLENTIFIDAINRSVELINNAVEF